MCGDVPEASFARSSYNRGTRIRLERGAQRANKGGAVPWIGDFVEAIHK
jgi:hypothetical protein